jgi:hypothetical protein
MEVMDNFKEQNNLSEETEENLRQGARSPVQNTIP